MIDELVMELECIETDSPSLKALRKAGSEFKKYIRNNTWKSPTMPSVFPPGS